MLSGERGIHNSFYQFDITLFGLRGKPPTYKGSPRCDCNGAFPLHLQVMMVIKRGIHVITSLNDLPVCSPQCSLKKKVVPPTLSERLGEQPGL